MLFNLSFLFIPMSKNNSNNTPNDSFESVEDFLSSIPVEKQIEVNIKSLEKDKTDLRDKMKTLVWEDLSDVLKLATESLIQAANNADVDLALLALLVPKNDHDNACGSFIPPNSENDIKFFISLFKGYIAVKSEEELNDIIQTALTYIKKAK